MIENATSADVTGWPSWNSAFLRRFSVSDLPSSASFHDSARYGCGFHWSSKRSGLAKSCVDGTAVAMPDCTAPFRWRGVWVLPMTSVPPFLPSSARAESGKTAATSKAEVVTIASRRVMTGSVMNRAPEMMNLGSQLFVAQPVPTIEHMLAEPTERREGLRAHGIEHVRVLERRVIDGQLEHVLARVLSDDALGQALAGPGGKRHAVAAVAERIPDALRRIRPHD